MTSAFRICVIKLIFFNHRPAVTVQLSSKALRFQVSESEFRFSFFCFTVPVLPESVFCLRIVRCFQKRISRTMMIASPRMVRV